MTNPQIDILKLFPVYHGAFKKIFSFSVCFMKDRDWEELVHQTLDTRF